MTEENTAPAPKKQRKPRKASAFIALKTLDVTNTGEQSLAPQYALATDGASIKAVRASLEDAPPGRYTIVCVRETVDVSQEIVKSVKRAK